jgi:formate hydrogenlyase subunit 6/NADH:ubiquinone oxidoreductase subunit I
MALVALGMESVKVRTDACSECAWGTLLTLIDEHVAQTQGLLGAWNKATIIESISNIQETHVRPLWNAHNPPLSRRDLFRLASRQGQVALARSIEQKKTGSNHTPGRDRRRIINAVEHLSVSKAGADPILAGNSFAALFVSDSCTACGVCARACPTNALHYSTNPEKTTFQLTISTQFCIGCELCTYVCAPNAVVVDHTPSFSKVFGLEVASILREGELTKCEKCNGAFASNPETRFCPACDYRQKNPFGSIMPPGIKIPPQITPGGRRP